LFGRDSDRDALFNLLISQRIVLMYSPSGAGKTSLIEASLVPVVEAEGLRPLPTARVGLAPNLPVDGAEPVNPYVVSVLTSLGASADEYHLSLQEFLDRQRDADGQSQLLVIDQFEEILTEDPTDRLEKETFFRQLGAASRDHDRWILIAMREDFVGSLDPFLRFIPGRLSVRYRLDLLSAPAALAAIVEPGREAGVDFSPVAQQLVEELCMTRVQRTDGVVEFRPGLYVEPVQLQVVCMRIWEHLPPGTTTVQPADVQAVGDVDQALAGYYAERVAAIATAEHVRERDIREWVDQHLITLQNVRGQVLQSVDASEGLPNSVIRALVDAHLVRAERRRGFTWFELAHDRLVGPVREDNATWFRQHLSAFQKAANDWDRRERPPEALLHGAALKDAETWAGQHPSELTPVERDFLGVSAAARSAEERRINRIIRILAGAAILIGCVCAVLAVAASRYATYAEVGQLALSALDQSSIDPELGLLLAAEAANHDDTADSELALRQAALASRARLVLQGHTEPVWSAAFSPDAQRIVTASTDGSAWIWDAGTGTRLLQLATSGDPVCGAAYSPDGAQIAVAYFPAQGGGVTHPQLFDAATGGLLKSLEIDTHSHCSLAFSPDGTTLLTVDDDGAHLNDLRTGGEQAPPLHGGTGNDWAATFNHDGTQIAEVESDGTANVWDVASRTLARQIHVYDGNVWAVRFSPDDRYVATADDQAARIWDLETGETLDELVGHDDMLTDLAFTPDGARLVTTSHDETARIWGIASGATLAVLRGHTNGVRSVSISADGKLIATASDDGTARIWDADIDDEVVVIHAHRGDVLSGAYSPDGSTVLTTGADSTARLWNANTGAPLQTIQHGGPVWGGDFSHDGRYVVTASADGTARVSNVADGGLVLVLPVGGVVRAALFSPDDTRIATADSDGFVRLWDAASGTKLAQMRHGGEVRSLAFDPAGSRVASGGSDSRAIIWDTATGSAVLSIDIGVPVRSVAFGPGGRRLVTGSVDRRAQSWDARTGELRLAFQGAHAGPVWTAEFDPSGRRLVTASEDGTTVLWDSATGKRQIVLTGHTGPVRGAVFSPDGQRILTVSSGGIARTLGGCEISCSVPDLLKVAKSRLAQTHRRLSPQEEDQYVNGGISPLSLLHAVFPED
jgi:WD40 repeat protein